MVAPTTFFGGNSDGAMAMEDWLHEVCKGCRHGRVEQVGPRRDDILRGMGCELPARAYAFPYDDIPEWSQDADPPGPGGLTCMKKATRSRGVRRPRGVPASHPTLDLEAVTADG